MPTTLACPVVELLCFDCLVFQTISLLFESNKTRSGLNVIKTVIFVDENRKQDEGNALQEFEGLRPNCENKIKNGRNVNKSKMHRITISWGPCEKLGSTEWGAPELEVDNQG